MCEPITLYRYIGFSYGDGDVEIGVELYRAFKETPCGWWVVPDWWWKDWERFGEHFEGDIWEATKRFRRWVSKDGRRRYCYDTKQEAWTSFRVRTLRRLGHARRALELAEALEEYNRDRPHPPAENPIQVRGASCLLEFLHD